MAPSKYNKNKNCETVKLLISKLFSNNENYFKDGYLNSEGIKLLNIALRIAVKTCIEHVYYIKKARRTKSMEDVERVLRAMNIDGC